MKQIYQLNLRKRAESFFLIAIAVIFAATALVPLLYQSHAGAATLASRSVTASDSRPAQTGVTYTFSFDTQSNFDIQSMIFQFCDAPLGTCTLPGESGLTTADNDTEMDVDEATASPGAFTGTTATAFAEVTVDTGACTEADGGPQISTMYCVKRTETTDEVAGTKTFVINNVINPTIQSGNNEEIYVRISLYNDENFANAEDDGIVAASTVNQLIVTGVVQERLVFCVFALDDTAGSNGGSVGTGNGDYPTNCSANEATASSTVDIGVVDNVSIARSPVDNNPPTANGNDRFGAAMVNTNASNGVQVAYFPVQAGSGTNQLRSFRVTGATCNASATNLTDPCFQSAATTGTAYTAGSERFGMNIACIADSGTITAGTTANLGSGGAGVGTGNTHNQNYDGSDNDVVDDGFDNCETEASTNYAWDDSGTTVNLVAADTVVDDELIKLTFGATAEATTPTGSYTVSTVYIATPTF